MAKENMVDSTKNGRSLRRARKAKGHSQKLAAEKIGISQAYLSTVEAKGSNPSSDIAKAIKRVYGVAFG